MRSPTPHEMLETLWRMRRRGLTIEQAALRIWLHRISRDPETPETVASITRTLRREPRP